MFELPPEPSDRHDNTTSALETPAAGWRKHHHNAVEFLDMPQVYLAAAGVLAVVLVLATPFMWWQGRFLTRRYWTYPHTVEVLKELESLRDPPAPHDGRNDLRGVMHSHSLLSHDSMGTPEEIVKAAQRAQIDFVFLTDHPATPPKPVPPELQGEHGGVILVPGVETSQGMIAWFFDTTTIDPHASLADQIRFVQAAGGLAGVCHPDEPRPWDKLPPFTVTEIYNLHADAKKSKLSLNFQLSEQFWNMSLYPMQVFHELFHDPAPYLAIWDRLTQTRRITGIAGNDAHQNNGLRWIASRKGTLMLTDTSPKEDPMFELNNWFARRYAAHHPGETFWRMDADLYERSFHFVNTHLLVTQRNAAGLRQALEAGHAYVAFDSLVNATGFDFSYRVPGSWLIQGDETQFSPDGVLTVDLPVGAYIVLKRDGKKIDQRDGTHMSTIPPGPGVYRVEVYLAVGDDIVPWIYSNPIYLRN